MEGALPRQFNNSQRKRAPPGLLNVLAGVPATRAALHQASEELKARLRSSAGRVVTAHAPLQTTRSSA